MRILIYLKFSLLIIITPVLSDGQPLSELVDGIRDHNLEVLALHQEYLAALEKGPQLSQLPDPDIGVGAFIAPVETRLGAQRARISASQMIPWFGTLQARKDVTQAQAKAQFEKIASRELELGYQLKLAYFQLYEIQQTRNIIRQNFRILEALRRLALTKVESGEGNPADVLRVDLEIQELEQKLLILDHQWRKPLADLNQMLNRPSETSVQVQDSFGFASIPYPKDTVLHRIHTHHPTIRMFVLQQEASHKILSLNELEGKPTLGIGMDYILVASRSDADPVNNGNDIFQLSAKVSIPLWRQKYTAREKEENLRIMALENRKNHVENKFLSMIEKAFSDFEIAFLKQDLYTKQKATTDAAIQMLQADYSSSGRHFDELLSLEKDLIGYELKILEAIVESQMAQAAIERYITF